jgi:hypothetical protein
MLSPPTVTMQSCLLTFSFSVPVHSSIFSFNDVSFSQCTSCAFLCPLLCIKRCPAFVNKFNHSHKFIQLSLALNPATFTNIIGQSCTVAQCRDIESRLGLSCQRSLKSKSWKCHCFEFRRRAADSQFSSISYFRVMYVHRFHAHNDLRVSFIKNKRDENI